MVKIIKLFNRTNFSTSISIRRWYSRKKHPLLKTWDVLTKDIPFGLKKKPKFYPEHADVVIIGGGFLGSAVAYWLKTRGGDGLSVVVLDKDLTYRNAQVNLSQGLLSQHFSLPENILLSKYTSEFLRNSRESLGSNVDIKYNPNGHLVLASEQYKERLQQNIAIQKEFGTKNILLSSNNLQEKFPWLNTSDIELGCMASEAEGTFSSWALLQGFVNKSQELGATYVNAEVIGFEMEKQKDMLMEGMTPGTYERINKVVYRTEDNEEWAVTFAACILAAGDESRDIAKLAKIGVGDGLLSIPLPTEKREYNVYSIDNDNVKPSLNTPHIMDTSGLWLRWQGLNKSLLFGHIPLLSVESGKLLDSEYYDNIIKPSLQNRIPDIEQSKITPVSTEKVDICTYDDTGILGPHPYHNNLYMATGFGRNGCAHAPGIGRAIAELIVDSQFVGIDLTRFGFDRFIVNAPTVEFNMY